MELNHYFFENKKICLENNHLSVEISAPGSLYRGTRFDWTGVITQVTLDGKTTFCVQEPEQNHTNTNGVGLCNEFTNFIPIENDVSAGIPFPKLGIGILKPLVKGSFNNFLACEIDPFKVEMVQKDSHTIKFIAYPTECRGISVYTEKTITLQNNKIIIDYEMKNTGTVALHTREYNHNFIQINDYPIGPDYTMKFPYEISVDNLPEYISCEDKEIHINEIPVDSFYLLPKGYTTEPHRWELICNPLKVGISEENDFSAGRFAIWGRNNVISPEVFVNIDLEPGQSMKWFRKYSFINYDEGQIE